jgi:hypothetical protein
MKNVPIENSDPVMDVIYHLARWQPVSRDEQTQLQNQLAACVGSPEHPLFNQKTVARYKTKNTDDVIFEVSSSNLFARVHLTTQLETNPRFPDTYLFKSLMDWLRFELEDVSYLLEEGRYEI